MLKNLFKKKQSLDVINTHDADVALRLMFEIAISDGTLDSSELKLIKKRADKIASEDLKASTIVKKIIDEHQGKIWIKRPEDGGTCVILQLPMEKTSV